MKPQTRERKMRRVIALMRQYQKQFDMKYFVHNSEEALQNMPVVEALHNCNTSCCIAGFVVAAICPQYSTWRIHGPFAASLLKLDDDITSALFCCATSSHELAAVMRFPEGHGIYNTDINIGIAALRHAIKLQNQRKMAEVV